MELQWWQEVQKIHKYTYPLIITQAVEAGPLVSYSYQLTFIKLSVIIRCIICARTCQVNIDPGQCPLSLSPEPP